MRTSGHVCMHLHMIIFLFSGFSKWFTGAVSVNLLNIDNRLQAKVYTCNWETNTKNIQNEDALVEILLAKLSCWQTNAHEQMSLQTDSNIVYKECSICADLCWLLVHENTSRVRAPSHDIHQCPSIEWVVVFWSDKTIPIKGKKKERKII